MSRVARRLQIGRYFNDVATLIRVTADYDDCGRTVTAEAEAEIRCATAPVSGAEARSREPTEAGVVLDAARRFWLVDEVEPVSDNSPGDIIVYAGERWRVARVERWTANAHEVLAQRIEGQ